MHPWEDWAETWAHYMLIVDVLDTSTSYGVALLPDDPSEPTLTDRTPVEDASFENLMKRWFPLTYALNSLNRSLGMPDGYPFTLAAPVVEKLRFVHRVIEGAGDKSQPREAATPPGQAAVVSAQEPAAQAEVAQTVEATTGAAPGETIDAPAAQAEPQAAEVVVSATAPATQAGVQPTASVETSAAPLQPVDVAAPPQQPVASERPLQPAPIAAQSAPAKRARRR